MMPWNEMEMRYFLAETKIPGTVEHTLRSAALRIARANGAKLETEDDEDRYMQRFAEVLVRG